MNTYVVIKAGGSQHLVSEGDILELPKLNSAEEEIIFSDVLLFKSEGNLMVGNPNVTGVSVQAKILKSGKGKKIDVVKFKAKSRYRRKMGFRPHFSQIQIVKIKS